MINIEILGKYYEVQEGITILQAFWYVGQKKIRGVGCLGGFCGACSTVYRVADEDYKLHVGLACQTVVKEGMSLVQIPFFPVKQKTNYADEVRDNQDILLQVYPDLRKCISCGACTRVCPQDLNVLGYLIKAEDGDFEKSSEWSFDCINCGMCAMKCPMDLSPNLIGAYVREKNHKVNNVNSKNLHDRINEIESGIFKNEWDELFKNY